jgi:hypothetical protein
MNDAKFLGLCIVLAAVLISSTIVWSTTVTQAALAGQPAKDVSVSTTAPSTISTVKIDGPVTLAPFTAPMPVTITNSDDNPIPVKDISEEKWTR